MHRLHTCKALHRILTRTSQEHKQYNKSTCQSTSGHLRCYKLIHVCPVTLSLRHLTYLSRMQFPTLINWASPFSLEGLLGGILHVFFFNFNRTFCEQTVDPDQMTNDRGFISFFRNPLSLVFHRKYNAFSNASLTVSYKPKCIFM